MGIRRLSRICALQAETETDGEAPKVLQTYTVPLSKVKANLPEWIPSMKDEYEALMVGMKAVKKWRESELKLHPGYDTAEYAPSKLVNTMKAPNGRHRPRTVICGNLVEDLQTGKAARSADKQDLYAGGVDGVTARCVFRKAARHQWCLGSIDVKCAFLLAPRQESRRMLLTRPPRVFVDSGLCPSDEIWEVCTAMYGLETSPADWTAYRNTVLAKMQWTEAGRFFEVRPSVELRRSMRLIELYSDISFAPGGGRSNQGVLACYGGQVVQWEAVRQPFTTLSTAESELVGYIESMTMGESLSVVLDVLECGAWPEGDAEKVLYGDNLSALTILRCPDGPWRTRHLRLRAPVLRERVKSGQWLARHLPGADLMADYLTKVFPVASGWQKFWKMANMVQAGNDSGELWVEKGPHVTDKVAKLIGWTSALGIFASFSPTSEVLKLARIVGIVVATIGLAWIGSESIPKREFKMAKMQIEGTPRVDAGGSIPTESSDLIAERGPRERKSVNEPYPCRNQDGPRETNEPGSSRNQDGSGETNEPGSSRNQDGSREVNEPDPCRCQDGPREANEPGLSRLGLGGAMNGEELRFKSSKPRRNSEPAMINYTAPCLDHRLQEAPVKTSDRWWRMQVSGWHVREHGSTRKSLFHPLHKGAPFELCILEEDRITIMFPVNGDDVRVVKDVWAVPKDATRQQPWRGYALFKEKRSFLSPWGEHGKHGTWGTGPTDVSQGHTKWGVGPHDIHDEATKLGYFKPGLQSASGSSLKWDNLLEEEALENEIKVSYQKNQKKGILHRAKDAGIFGVDVNQDVTDPEEKRSVQEKPTVEECGDPKTRAVFSGSPHEPPSGTAAQRRDECDSWSLISDEPRGSRD